MQYKMIALLGKGGSGKDTIIDILKDLYPNTFNFIVKATTRPKRKVEVEDVDYHFVPLGEFLDDIDANEFVSYSYYNNNWYGIYKRELVKDKINICVLDLQLYETLQEYSKQVDILPIFIDADSDMRTYRMIRRLKNNPSKEEVKEVFRRISADEKEFENLNTDKMYKIINNGMKRKELKEQLVNDISIIIEEFS